MTFFEYINSFQHTKEEWDSFMVVAGMLFGAYVVLRLR